MEYLIYILVVGVIVLTILLLRTTWFKASQDYKETINLPDFDTKRAVETLQNLIRFKTVSYEDKSLEDRQAFLDFALYLKQRFPKINAQATFDKIGETGLLFHIEGKSTKQPIVLMSHYDVVPENGSWQHPPFCGNIIDNHIYGRGAVDTKGTLAAVMESVEHVLKTGNQLTNDLYLAFSGDEETRGPSAPAIVDYLKQKNIRPWLVLDEGGAIVDDVFPGVTRKAAVIGTGEKGYLNLKLTKSVAGSHAAMPPKEMAIPTLAKAVRKLDNPSLFKIRKPEATRQFFNTIARHTTDYKIKCLFANERLLNPLLKYFINKKSGLMASLYKTTQSFTMVLGSEAMNVLPSEASLFINYRIITGETVESVKRTVEKRVQKYGITCDIMKGADPTPLSKTDGSYHVLVDTIRQTWGNIIVSPYLMMAGTDARYHHDISDHVYRFSPLRLDKKTRATVHGVDEKLAVDNYLSCVGFYINLLNNLVVKKQT